MRPVNVGLIGCGNISAAYLRAAPKFDDIRIVSCADLDPARARDRAREFGLSAAGSVEELLADRDIEVVLNLTIPQAHVPVGLAAIAAGKHVHSEKPLAVSTAEARSLLDAAQAAGLRIGCAPDTFLGGSHQTARGLIDAGKIGRPLAGTAFMMNHGHEHWHPDPGFYYAGGGGPLFDMGPYYLTNLVNLLGPVESVVGSATSGYTQRTIESAPRRGESIEVQVPTHITGILSFVSGAVVTITTSFDVWKHRHGHMEIYGTEGSLIVPDPNRFGGTVSVAARRGEWEDVPPTHGYFDDNYRILGLADMARAIRTGRPHRCSGALAFHVLEVMEAILRAGQTHGAVRIESRCPQPAPLPPRSEIGKLD
jgi:predicted dehydrogenase